MNEVKRQAMSEVQKAVAEAEQKAFEMIASERARMEQTIADAKRQATEDAFLVINEQEESTEVQCQGQPSCRDVPSGEFQGLTKALAAWLPRGGLEPAGPPSLFPFRSLSVVSN